MKFNEYQELTQRTMNDDLGAADRIVMLALGLAGETGETVDMIKKFKFHHHTLNLREVSEELGDIMWYIAGLAEALGLEMENIAIDNIKKLKKRYPNGFSKEDSINRSV